MKSTSYDEKTMQSKFWVPIFLVEPMFSDLCSSSQVVEPNFN